MPVTRRSFWMTKLLKNKRRDLTTRRKLRRAGWDVLVVWECQTSNIKKLMDSLEIFLH
jgi:DNA mismatch endonuclease (patch repair protein)